jgi:hypothetical protein
MHIPFIYRLAACVPCLFVMLYAAHVFLLKSTSGGEYVTPGAGRFVAWLSLITGVVSATVLIYALTC